MDRKRFAPDGCGPAGYDGELGQHKLWLIVSCFELT
jgi:hypothetical protein